MLIDSHAHLIDEKIVDVEGVISSAFEAGVQKIITPTTCVADFEKALAISSEHKYIYTLLGIHPENADKLQVEFGLAEIRCRLKRKGVVGIGEIGLDFYHDKEKITKRQQVDLFKKQLELALEFDLPVVIHSREAVEETIEVLSSLPKMPKGQFHCFAGDVAFLEWVLKQGFFVSFAGNLTFKSATDLREMIGRVPNDKLLLETDSPYLSPEPIRGRVNEPKNVKIIAEFVARLRGVSIELLAERTSNNALCLYSLEE